MKTISFPFISTALLLVLLAADVISSILLFQNTATNLPFILHGVVSLLASFIFYWEKRSKQTAGLNFFFYGFQFLFVFILPVIGLVGAYIFANHSLFINHKKKHNEAIDDLLDTNDNNTLDLPLESEKTFKELLRHQDPESYLQLILSTHYMQESHAIRILKFALNTDIENVRLLAQALLDSKENKINQTLEKHIALTQTTKHKKNSELHLNIAQHYWNLANLGLAKDAVLEHVLTQLQIYTDKVKAIRPTEPSSYYLAGRGLLLEKKFPQAEQQFQLALQAGMPESRIVLALREINAHSESSHSRPCLSL